MLNLGSYPERIPYKPHLFSEDISPLNEHALLPVSTFNSYFSVENMEKLFLWADQNFNDFTIFFMNEASIFNLIALGYTERKALGTTRKHDNYLKNKVFKSLTNIGFSSKESEKNLLFLSDISQNQRYIELHKSYLKNFEENSSFRNDCLEVTRLFLLNKIDKITNEASHLAVKYLLAELPLWLNTPYVLNIRSSTLIYKDLSPPWQRICYNYDLLPSNQQIMIKSVI